MTASNTRVLPFGEAAVAEAARLILAGEPVAVPTETVYGLAADATNAEAVARVYAAKSRPSFNPLIVHVLSIDYARQFGAVISEEIAEVADIYWPGPLTLVVPVSPFAHLAPSVTAGLGTVAVRSPAHPAMRALLQAAGRPLAAPSANASGRLSPTRAEHVDASLNGRISLILDAGPTEYGVESTIVKIDHRSVQVLRPGPVDGDQIAVLLKLKHDLKFKGKVEAPGQLESHYAPSKPLRLEAEIARPGEYLIGFGPVAGHATLSATGDLVEAAARLFDLLHQADAAPEPRIAIAPIPSDGLGLAIRDRLQRAAHA